MGKGCINCGALLEVLREKNIHNWDALGGVVSIAPHIDTDEEGCWSYIEWNREDYPICLSGLKDNDQKVIQARDEIKRAREAIRIANERYARERARQFRKVERRRVP